ncbi:MAG: acyl-CoA reductase [Cyclobacteriaceae bacterium]
MQMILEERIEALSLLGDEIEKIGEDDPKLKEAENKNPWFTQENIQLAFKGIHHLLDREKLIQWTNAYSFDQPLKVIGVAMAGNIPLVGFHDYLSILISGHKAQIKLSSQDETLLPLLHQKLVSIKPAFEEMVSIQEKLSGFDAAIATGSDNTARYFKYYFGKVPNIIRMNRSSCAVLMGEESEDEFALLGQDVFQYFGLGCRNVSKIYIPEEFDLVPLLRAWEKFIDVADHNKYANNYNYQRSIHLVNQKHFYDNGAILLIEEERLVSPIGVVYYERYSSQDDLKSKLAHHADKIQCIVSAKGWYQGSIAFGKAQTPEPWDYADGVDTLKFLSELH